MNNIFLAIVKKEITLILRDRRTMFITIFMPLILLLLFGFAISMEVNDVRVVAVVERHTERTRDILQRIEANDYFSFKGIVNAAEVNDILTRDKADAALILRERDGVIESQVVVDALNPTVSRTVTAYLSAVVKPQSNNLLIIRTLFNPQLKSAYNFVPGIMGMIFILICAIMTSVSIVSEKERGTLDLLLISPAKPSTIIFGKLLPYFLLSCIILAVMLTMAYTVLDLPFSSTVVSVVLITILYVILSLAIGLLVSTVVETQVAAMIVSAVMFMTPVMLLSGMIFPVDNMPLPLQWVSCIIPARWYIDAMRILMIQQSDITFVAKDIAILMAMTMVILAAAIAKFKASNK